MQNHFEVIVVGGGVMGAATAYQLSKRNASVLLIEQFQIGNIKGSSHGPSRIIRLAYDGVDYGRMAQASYAQWRELENESNQELMKVTGGFDFGPPHATYIDGIRQTYLALNIPFEEIRGDEIIRRFPQINIPSDSIALYQPDYAVLAADRCVASLAKIAKRYGATIHENETAQFVRPSANSVEVVTQRDTYTTDRVILCAGAWMRPMLLQLRIDLPLKVTKEQTVFYRAKNPEDFLPGRFPLFLERHPGSTVIGNAFPIYNSPYVKAIFDRNGIVIDPDQDDREINPEAFAKLRAYIANILPTLGDDVVETATCLYTMTPDEDFILDKHPAHANVVIASPCSGHGFKFGPVIGGILADLALDGRTKFDIERFRLSRFGEAVRTLERSNV
jgi:sarcosine oxidase